MPAVVSPYANSIVCSTILFSSIIISSSSSSGISTIGVAPETVIVFTKTLSATTTVKRTTSVLDNEETVIEVTFGKKALITGPVLSSLTIESVTELDEELLFTSVAEKVNVSKLFQNYNYHYQIIYYKYVYYQMNLLEKYLVD